jgi:CheY-like chemotaxis protein/HPt (histidine-containing phosphotransfer) domain-containing protein
MIQNPTEVMQEDIAKNWTPEAHDLTGVRVLLAEDGYDNRELIQAVLQRVGASVETAENGRIALNKAKDDMFDVILMDMNMPEMDGYEATGKLRDLGYDGPIVALTANAMVGDGDRCKVAGCDEYLTKPIDRALLIQTIAECAETRKAARPAADRPAERRPESETPATPPAPTRNEDAMISEFIDDPAMAPIIERFVGRLADQLEAMHQTLAARQYEDLRRLAHKLKGAGGSYGYPLLTETSRALEEAAKMQDGEAAGLALRRVAEVARAVQKAFLGTIDQK